MVSAVEASRPAILGGTKAVNLDQSQANRWPIITDEDVAAVTEVLRSGELSLNDVIGALEADYRDWLGTKHAIAYCNGTSAILAGLSSFNLKPGDEVLVPSATYWASVMPILWCGAVPIFCEIEMEQGGLDPADVERKITSKTRAMVLVHLWGMPCKLDELMGIARRHGLKVLEDASHAHGAKYKGRWVGTFGDAAVFSLQTSKLAPAGEGGILVTDDDNIHEHVLCLGHYERILDLQTPARRFAGTGFGMKHRIAPLSAAVARVQLQHLFQRNAVRNNNLIYLSGQLERLGISTILPPEGIERVYFVYLAENDETRTGLPHEVLVAALRAEGCQVSHPRYPLLHAQPVFTEDKFIDIARLRHLPRESLPVYRADDLPATIAVNERLIQLPAFPNAERQLLDQYGLAFEKVLSSASEIMASRCGAVIGGSTQCT